MEKRDQQERENLEAFINNIQDYPPPIPDSVIKNIMSTYGMNTDDIRVIHTMNVACQKFISDVLTQTTAIAKARAKEDKSQKNKKIDLQICDLKNALLPYDIHVNRPEFIVSIPKETKIKKNVDRDLSEEEEEEDQD